MCGRPDDYLGEESLAALAPEGVKVKVNRVGREAQGFRGFADAAMFGYRPEGRKLCLRRKARIRVHVVLLTYAKSVVKLAESRRCLLQVELC
jgi:hypothetical protein